MAAAHFVEGFALLRLDFLCCWINSPDDVPEHVSETALVSEKSGADYVQPFSVWHRIAGRFHQIEEFRVDFVIVRENLFEMVFKEVKEQWLLAFHVRQGLRLVT